LASVVYKMIYRVLTRWLRWWSISRYRALITY